MNKTLYFLLRKVAIPVIIGLITWGVCYYFLPQFKEDDRIPFLLGALGMLLIGNVLNMCMFPRILPYKGKKRLATIVIMSAVFATFVAWGGAQLLHLFLPQKTFPVGTYIGAYTAIFVAAHILYYLIVEKLPKHSKGFV
jgi:hypothetical protein